MDIWAHSDPAVISSILEFISLMTQSTLYKNLLVIFALIGFLGNVIMSIQGRARQAVNFMLGLALFMLVLMPKTTVFVKDVSAPASNTRTVFNIPYLIAFPMHLFTTAGKWLGEQTEQAMYTVLASKGLPSSSRIYNSNSAPGLILKLMRQYNRMDIPSDLYERISMLYDVCLVPQATVTSATGLLPNGTPWTSSTMYANCTAANATMTNPTASNCLLYTSPRDHGVLANSFMVVTDPKDGITKTCIQFWNSVSTDANNWALSYSGKLTNWNGMNIDKALKGLTGKLKGNTGVGGYTTNANVYDTYKWRGYGQVLARYIIDTASSSDATAGLKQVLTSAANAGTGQTFAEVFVDYLPQITDICLAIICAFFPLAVLVIVMTTSSMNRIVQYFSVMLSIAFWPPMIATLNALIQYYSLEHSELITQLTQMGALAPDAVLGSTYVASLSASPIAALGYMMAAVPLISLGLVKGGEVAFSHAFQNLTGGAKQTAGQVALDRFSVDTMSIGTHTGPSRDLEGASKIANKLGGTSELYNKLGNASTISHAEKIGDAEGKTEAARKLNPGKSVPESVMDVSKKAGAMNYGSKHGSTRALGKNTQDIAIAADNKGYQDMLTGAVKTASDYYGLAHMLAETFGANLDEDNIQELAHQIQAIDEDKYEGNLGKALAHIHAANQNGMKNMQGHYRREFNNATNLLGKAIAAKRLSKLLGYKTLTDFYTAASNGTLAQQMVKNNAFEQLAEAFGGGANGLRKGLENLGISLGLDHAQSALSAQYLVDMVTDENGNIDQNKLRHISMGEAFNQYMARLVQAGHGHHQEELANAAGGAPNLANAAAAKRTSDWATGVAQGKRLEEAFNKNGHFDLPTLFGALNKASLSDMMDLFSRVALGTNMGDIEKAKDLGMATGFKDYGKFQGPLDQMLRGMGIDPQNATEGQKFEAFRRLAVLAAAVAGGETAEDAAEVTTAGGGDFYRGASGAFQKQKAIAASGNYAKGVALMAAVGGLSKDEAKAFLGIKPYWMSDKDFSQMQQKVYDKVRRNMVQFGATHGVAEATVKSVKNAIASLGRPIAGMINNNRNDTPATEGTEWYSGLSTAAVSFIAGVLATIAHQRASKKLSKKLFKDENNDGGNNTGDPAANNHDATLDEQSILTNADIPTNSVAKMPHEPHVNKGNAGHANSPEAEPGEPSINAGPNTADPAVGRKNKRQEMDVQEINNEKKRHERKPDENSGSEGSSKRSSKRKKRKGKGKRKNPTTPIVGIGVGTGAAAVAASTNDADAGEVGSSMPEIGNGYDAQDLEQQPQEQGPSKANGYWGSPPSSGGQGPFGNGMGASSYRYSNVSPMLTATPVKPATPSSTASPTPQAGSSGESASSQEAAPDSMGKAFQAGQITGQSMGAMAAIQRIASMPGGVKTKVANAIASSMIGLGFMSSEEAEAFLQSVTNWTTPPAMRNGDTNMAEDVAFGLLSMSGVGSPIAILGSAALEGLDRLSRNLTEEDWKKIAEADTSIGAAYETILAMIRSATRD